MDTPLEGTATGTLSSGPPDSLNVNVTLNPAPSAPPDTGGTTEDPQPQKEWKYLSVFLIALAVFWVAFCVLFPSVPSLFTASVQWFWVVNIILFGAAGLSVGYCLRGRLWGIFINEQKMMSLSRLQVLLWTLLVLSALFTLIAARIQAGVADPVNIFVDEHLWEVMGISLGSFAGRTAIMGKKSATDPGSGVQLARAVQRTANRMGRSAGEIMASSIGVLYAHKTIDDASFTDMFQSDEISNKSVVDIGKVQMFFFTVLTVAAYAGAIWTMLLHTDIGSISGLPILSDGFVALLFVSHAGLIANSATTATPVS